MGKHNGLPRARVNVSTQTATHLANTDFDDGSERVLALDGGSAAQAQLEFGKSDYSDGSTQATQTYPG